MSPIPKRKKPMTIFGFESNDQTCSSSATDQTHQYVLLFNCNLKCSIRIETLTSTWKTKSKTLTTTLECLSCLISYNVVKTVSLDAKQTWKNTQRTDRQITANLKSKRNSYLQSVDDPCATAEVSVIVDVYQEIWWKFAGITVKVIPLGDLLADLTVERSACRA